MNDYIERLKELIRNYDFSFLTASSAIFFVGILNLYSATGNIASPIFRNQILWYIVSVFVAFVISSLSSKSMFRFAYFVFIGNILLLVLVLVLGKMGMGARRWLVVGPIRLQPSEIMKVSLVLALARWYALNQSFRGLRFRDLIVPGILTGVPAVLIILQPDLGTGTLLFLIFIVISFFRNLSWKTILTVGLLGMFSAFFMYQFGLKQYQKKRIETFINPYQDAKGSGYNAIQSEIAIGSGRVFGKGYRKSSQASLKFLPENHTDFVFSVFNEEHGFFGSVLLVSLYLILLLRFVWLAMSVSKFFDSLMCIGIMAIFFWHTFINMGMVMGLMPIVGLPLPYMSYGGSSLVTFGICIGIATSISNSKSMFQS